MSSPELEGQDVPQEGADRPEWLPENFKTPEDLAKSYSESRKEMDRLRSELDQERQQFVAALEQYEAVNQQQRQPDPGDNGTNQLIQQYQQALDTGDAGAQLAITLALNKQLMDQALDERFKQLTPNLDASAQADRDIAFQLATDRVEREYGDRWDDLKEPVQAWLREHQSWLPAVNDPKAFETVIREAARTVENDKAAEQLRALEADRAAKLSAATSTGSGQGKFPTATDDKKQQWEEIKNADVVSYGELRRG
jgi:hypothetical protein